MVLPPSLCLGFFAAPPDRDDWLDRSVEPGPRTEVFESWVAQLFGELPRCGEQTGPIWRDGGGGLTVFLGDLVERRDVADALLELQRRTDCQCVLDRRFRAHLIEPGVMARELRHYVEEFGKALAWWREQTARRERGE